MPKDNNGDSFWDNPFGGMFDFDGDGTEDLGEQWIAYNILEDIMNDDGPDMSSDWDSDRTHGRHSDRSAARPSDKRIIKAAGQATKGQTAKKPLSSDEYADFRREAFIDILKDALIWLTVCAVIIAVIMWSVIDSNPTNKIGMYFAFGAFTLFLLFIFTRLFFSKRRLKWESYRDTEQDYMASLGEEQSRAIKHKRAMIRAAAAAVLCAIGFGACAFFGVRHAMLVSAYEDAQAFTYGGYYGAAMLLLEDIEDKEYKDTLALKSLCEAHIEYDKGNLSDAYHAINNADFRYQSAESLERIRSFWIKLHEEYDQYIEETYQKEREAYSKRLASGVPYVGMSESDIRKTSLGSPSNIRHDYFIKNGDRNIANLYEFYDGKRLIFTARCEFGLVSQVWDDRNRQPYVPDKNITYHSEPSVDRFSNPEDFYDFYYDNFADYYDAEKYYTEHGGR